MDTPIALLFKAARLRMGSTQAEIAALLGQHGYKVGQTFITQVERGKSCPAKEHAGSIARAFRIEEGAVLDAILATKHPGLKLVHTQAKHGFFVEFSPQEEKRLLAVAEATPWPSVPNMIRKVMLKWLDAQEDNMR